MAHVIIQTPEPMLLQNPVVPLRRGRAAALLAITCLLAHIPLIASHFTLAPVTTAIMAVVSLMCIPCARKLWKAPTTQDCIIAALLAAAMVGMHVALTFAMAAGTSPANTDITVPSHHHAGAAADPVQPAPRSNLGHHIDMAPAIEAMYYLATTMAVLQILLNIVAVTSTVRRAKAHTSTLASVTATYRPAAPS